ncbi:MAG: SPASM domain-containing protein [Oscillospiraceae bacterium]|nr:SPASM domain-containing protein [Oscillospiraceae bacterium]
MLKKVYLEITNICNLACVFCPGTAREPRMLGRGEFRLLASRLRPHAEYLYFHLMGEPLLHPLLGDFLEIAGELGFRVMITTNGTLLRERAEVLCASPALLKVNISLQSFEANGGGDPGAYLDGCIGFARMAADAGKRCEFRLWNRRGLETLNSRIEERLCEAFPKPWKKSREGWKLRENVWLEPGDHFDWPAMEAADRGENCFCYGLRDQIGVLCDGTVVPCCLDHEGDLALGNLFEEELDEILQSARARAIRDGFSRRIAVEALCRRCGFARKF